MPALKTLIPKFTLPKASTWLPAVVAVICVCLFGTAAAVLFSVGADPESGPSPVVTSVSGQGFQGLRRLLTADGHLTVTNRFDDSETAAAAGKHDKTGRDQVMRGDVEVITFEAYDPNFGRAASRQSASASSGEGASSESASASQASSEETPAEEETGDAVDIGPPPFKRQSDHVLQKPLGRAVIIILPKWQTQMAQKNRRWGAGARLIPAAGINRELIFLSPMSESPNPDTAESDGTSLKDRFDEASKALDEHAPDAVAKLQAVAEAGYPKAQLRLGDIYNGQGDHLPKNPAKARFWTQKAADNGLPNAMYNLGLYFYDGYGGPQDRTAAARWFRGAAERGLRDGQYNLALMYDEGDGVRRDPIEAYKWMSLAARSGDEEAKGLVEEFAGKLTPAERKAADTEVAAFVPMSGAQPGKAVYDTGDTLIAYDKIDYDIRRAHSVGPLTLSPAGGQGVFAGPLKVGRIDDLQSIRAPNLVPVLLGPDGEPVISRLVVTGGRPQPKTPVYVVADPDLLNNQILADPQKVATALLIFDRLSAQAGLKTKKPSVVFNLTFNDMAFDRDLLHALSRPPFVAVPLSLLLFGLGLMWAAFARFGPPRLAEADAALGRGVRILADNAARLMAVTMKEAKLGPAYAQMIRDEVLRSRGHTRLGARPDEDADALADRIGTLSGAEDLYTDLKRRSATILTVHQLIDLTQRLHAWKSQIEKTEIDRANI